MNTDNLIISKYIVATPTRLANSNSSDPSPSRIIKAANKELEAVNYGTTLFGLRDENAHLLRMNSGIVEMNDFLKQVHMNEAMRAAQQDSPSKYKEPPTKRMKLNQEGEESHQIPQDFGGSKFSLKNM
jgi:hypothetical protein